MFSRCRKKPEEPPPPKAPIPRSEFKDPPLPTVELQTLAHLAANVVTAATPDRYRMLDLALREELAEPGVELEAMAPYSKRRLMAMMTIIWKHREPYMVMRDSEMAEMSGHLVELEGDEYTRAKCKKLSMAQRIELDTRSEGYEYEEVDIKAFLGLLFKLKKALGYFSPPPRPSLLADAAAGGDDASSFEPPPPPKPAEVFYDVGSGAGKAVFCAAIFHNFKKISDRDGTKINFAATSFEAAEDWTKATTLFVFGSTYPTSLFELLASKAHKLKEGALIISVTREFRELDTRHWHRVGKTTMPTPAVESTRVFIYERT